MNEMNSQQQLISTSLCVWDATFWMQQSERVAPGRFISLNQRDFSVYFLHTQYPYEIPRGLSVENQFRRRWFSITTFALFSEILAEPHAPCKITVWYIFW